MESFKFESTIDNLNRNPAPYANNRLTWQASKGEESNFENNSTKNESEAKIKSITE